MDDDFRTSCRASSTDCVDLLVDLRNGRGGQAAMSLTSTLEGQTASLIFAALEMWRAKRPTYNGDAGYAGRFMDWLRACPFPEQGLTPWTRRTLEEDALRSLRTR